MEESTSKATTLYKYEISAIRTESKDQKISAAYLQKAIEKARVGRIDEARRFIEEAKTLLPSYSEPYRISGFIEANAGQLYKANNEYESALLLDPTSNFTRFTYATFLLRFLDDSRAAIDQIGEALKTDPDDPSLNSTYALCLSRLGRYEEAVGIYERLILALSTSQRWWIPIRDQAAECYRRWAEQAEEHDDHNASTKRIIRSVEIIKAAFESNHFDEELTKRYSRVLQDGLRYAVRNRNNDLARELLESIVTNQKFSSWHFFARISLPRLKQALAFDRQLINLIDQLTMKRILVWQTEEEQENQAVSGVDSAPPDSPVLQGTLHSIAPGTSYGFIDGEDGARWFFHKKLLSDSREWIRLEQGSRVSFQMGRNSQGPCATNIKVLGETNVST